MAAHISQQYCLDILSKRKCDLTYDESFGLIPQVKKMLLHVSHVSQEKENMFLFLQAKIRFWFVSASEK